MSQHILSSLWCDSVAVSDDLNPHFFHSLLPFSALCSHLFYCAGTLLCLTQSIAIKAAFGCTGEGTVTEWVCFRIKYLCREGSARDNVVVFLCCFFLKLKKACCLHFFTVLQFVLITPLYTNFIVYSCKKLSCHWQYTELAVIFKLIKIIQ